MNYKKSSKELQQSYWENQYKNDAIGWDIGAVSTPLEVYFNQLTTKELAILIPGAGNSYEAEYLYNQGFKNVDVVDFALLPLKNLKKRVPSFPEKQLIQKDFFVHDKKYDLIVEQTFFCALDPTLRTKYVEKMHDLLTNEGKLIGLFFDVELTAEGPPFGGSLKEYLQLFSNRFNIKVLDKCHNSIKPRLGSELFFIFEKK